MKYISQDDAKCAGNPESDACTDCLRKTLPVNPDALRQVWVAPWLMRDDPCPSRWVERAENRTDWSAA